MVVEAVVGESLGVTEAGTSDRLRAALEPLVGPLHRDVDPHGVASRLGSDKKNRAGRIRCVLLERLGRVAPGRGWTHEVTEAIVVEALGNVAAEPPRTS
jgi:3-dehydroquinate synthetase